MTRSKRLSKLGNAIREYRGVYYSNSGKWKRPPKPEAVKNILRWLTSLGVEEPITCLSDIQAFRNFDEMREWIAKI